MSCPPHHLSGRPIATHNQIELYCDRCQEKFATVSMEVLHDPRNPGQMPIEPVRMMAREIGAPYHKVREALLEPWWDWMRFKW